jgi:hypothetical protein
MGRVLLSDNLRGFAECFGWTILMIRMRVQILDCRFALLTASHGIFKSKPSGSPGYYMPAYALEPPSVPPRHETKLGKAIIHS